MAKTADITFTITGWDEETITENEDGGKRTRVRVTKSYAGDLQGTGNLDYLMTVRPDGSARFLGYESVSATLLERSGGFVFEHTGVYKDGVVDSTWSIVEGSGTGELAGISGTVAFVAGHQEQYSITLEYTE